MKHVYTFAAGLFALVIGLTSMPAFAQSIEQRLRQLEKLTETLQEALTDARAEIAQMKSEQSKQKDAAYKIDSQGGGLQFSKDDGTSFNLHGRIMMDYDFYDDVLSANGESASEGELRRTRLTMSGGIKKDWKYKLTLDIDDQDNESKVDTGYIQYVGFKPLALTFGKFKEPFSLERLTSSKWISTIERNLILAAIEGDPGLGAGQPRTIGIGVSGYHADMANFNWAIGVFDDGIEDSDKDDSFAYTGRIALAPHFGENHFIHLGAAYSIRDLEGNSFRVRPRLATHTEKQFVLGKSDRIGDVDQYGLEAAYQRNQFSLQAEYYNVDMDGEQDETGNQHNDLEMDGYYIQGTYTLTGEARGYKKKSATYDKLKPKGAYGAWELVARYSNLEIDDGAHDDVEVDQYILGVNWYANQNIRFMLNYTYAEVDQYEADQAVIDEINLRNGHDDGEAISLRFQYIW